jgi:hypothetical protein
MPAPVFIYLYDTLARLRHKAELIPGAKQLIGCWHDQSRGQPGRRFGIPVGWFALCLRALFMRPVPVAINATHRAAPVRRLLSRPRRDSHRATRHRIDQPPQLGRRPPSARDHDTAQLISSVEVDDGRRDRYARVCGPDRPTKISAVRINSAMAPTRPRRHRPAGRRPRFIALGHLIPRRARKGRWTMRGR